MRRNWSVPATYLRVYDAFSKTQLGDAANLRYLNSLTWSPPQQRSVPVQPNIRGRFFFAITGFVCPSTNGLSVPVLSFALLWSTGIELGG